MGGSWTSEEEGECGLGFLKVARRDPYILDRAARCLDSLCTTHGQFKGKNVTRYLRNYESRMKVNLVDPTTVFECFIALADEGVHCIVLELLKSSAGDWSVFSDKMKEEFSFEDADRLTRSTFSAWVVDRSKTLGPIALLREFERKLKQLPASDVRAVEDVKVDMFLEAAGPRMRREIDRALNLFNPYRSEDDTEWTDLVRAVKKVEQCRRRGEDEVEQTPEMQDLVEEMKKLQAMVAKQGVAPGPSYSGQPTIFTGSLGGISNPRQQG